VNSYIPPMAHDLSEQVTSADPPAAARAVASYRADLVMALLGAWFTVGLLLDAWAHNNLARLETFFTPWHAVFYTGFAATAAWTAWICRAALVDGRIVRSAIPVGYGATLVAIVGFAVAGVGDFTWHTVLGIEQNINILFSPTHLGLVASMFVIVSTPLRSAWANRSLPAAPGLVRLLPAVLGLSFATMLVLLFLQYANALTHNGSSVVFALSNMEQNFTASMVSDIAVTNAVLVLPLLTLARRWAPPPGTIAILYLVLGTLSTAVTGFDNVPLVVAFVVTGVGLDALLPLLRPAASLLRYRLFGAAVGLLTWSVFIANAFAGNDGVHGPGSQPLTGQPELYTGVPLVQGALGLLLACLLVPTERARQHPVKPRPTLEHLPLSEADRGTSLQELP
jgi:hypothetical protein